MCDGLLRHRLRIPTLETQRRIRHRYRGVPAVSGKSSHAGISARAPDGTRASMRTFSHRSRRALGLFCSQQRRFGEDRRTDRASPRRLIRPQRSGSPGGRRQRSRDTAPGNDFTVVEQGHRHRPPLRPRGRVADRARHCVDGRADGRRSIRNLESARRIGSDPRPHDAARVAGGRFLLRRGGSGGRYEGDLSRRNASCPLDDWTRHGRTRSSGGRERLPRPCPEPRGDRLPSDPVP